MGELIIVDQFQCFSIIYRGNRVFLCGVVGEKKSDLFCCLLHSKKTRNYLT